MTAIGRDSGTAKLELFMVFLILSLGAVAPKYRIF
jgi:hypothetical protein